MVRNEQFYTSDFYISGQVNYMISSKAYFATTRYSQTENTTELGNVFNKMH
jgi:hypothetical protein